MLSFILKITVMKIQIYFAPLQGYTDSIYISCYENHFGKFIKKYFTPFIKLKNNQNFQEKDLKTILFANKSLKQKIVPQILTNTILEFNSLLSIISNYSYNEINWNLGCPFPMHVKRGLGGGLLAYPEKITHILDSFFTNPLSNSISLSIKTRIGIKNPDEIFKILDVFNRYPIKYIIIHPRTVAEQYKGDPHHDIFANCLKISKIPLIYNGNISSNKSLIQLKKNIPNLSDLTPLMIGRGILKNPLLPLFINEHDLSIAS